MILAAGLGTRLRPLTDHTPKALIEVGGVPLLEHVARRLIEAGATRLIVNVHHRADLIERFVAERAQFGVEVRMSREEERPLETGGGLAAAAPLFEAAEPFWLHNVDVLSEVDLRAMRAAHVDDPEGRLATLAVSCRDTSRPLLVDDLGVYGVANHVGGWLREARAPCGGVREVGFAGVHVISPDIFGLLEERGAFSIVDAYLRLISGGQRVVAYELGDAAWMEVGSLDRLEQARRALG